MSVSDCLEDVRRYNQGVQMALSIESASSMKDLAYACGWTEEDSFSPEEWVRDLIAFMQRETDAITTQKQLTELGIHFSLSFWKERQENLIKRMQRQFNVIRKTT